MPSTRNTELLQKIKEKLSRAAAVFFVDYHGLVHKQLEEARTLLRNTDSDFSIVKNTLLGIALKEKKLDIEEKLTGPHAAVFSFGEPLAAVRALYSFIKKYNVGKIRFGIFEGKIIDEDTVITLATLPSREALLGKLVGILKSPMTGLVYDLNWNVQKLVMVLKEMEKQKSN